MFPPLFPPSLSLSTWRGVECCEELIKSGLDINHFSPSSSFSSSSERRPCIDFSQVTASPILARKASIIEEWTNLERTRALSQSEDDSCCGSPTISSARVVKVEGTSSLTKMTSSAGMATDVESKVKEGGPSSGGDVCAVGEEHLIKKFVTAK